MFLVTVASGLLSWGHKFYSCDCIETFRWKLNWAGWWHHWQHHCFLQGCFIAELNSIHNELYTVIELWRIENWIMFTSIITVFSCLWIHLYCIKRYKQRWLGAKNKVGPKKTKVCGLFTRHNCVPLIPSFLCLSGTYYFPWEKSELVQP